MKPRPDDLETRVANRKRQLITEIIEHKRNSSRFGAAEAIDNIKHHLSELSHIVKTDEWTKLSAGARLRLAEWVAR
jgi:prephenate dehydrogenase